MKNEKSQIRINYALRILKASFTATEQMFVAKILYFNFLARETIPATLLDHIFLEEKILEVIMTKLINSYFAFFLL